MEDLKSVTLSYLRDLARKHLGPGHSKLNKTELIAALADFVPALKKLARVAGIELPTRTKAATKATPSATKPAREGRGKEARAGEKKVPERKAPEPKKAPEKKAAELKKAPEPKKAPETAKAAEAKKAPEPRKAVEAKKAPEPKKAPEAKKAPEPKKAPEAKKASEAKKAPEPKKAPEKKASTPQGRKPAATRSSTLTVDEGAQSSRHAQVVNFPPRPRQARSAEEEWAEAEVVDSPELESVFQHAAEPLMEGFFVARLMGERELRRHHLTEDQAPRSVAIPNTSGFEEELGELPLDYGNDLALALARDPHTLFISWDFRLDTLARTREGLESPRAMLRVFDGERLVRELEFAPESRSFYIHGLPPGRPYRVEAHFVGRDGRSRRLGHSTHPLILPRSGPSQDTTIRFMQMPPPPVVPVISPTSVPVATPAPAPAEAAPSTPTRAPSVEEREYITWRRVALPGSDEMASVAEPRRERIERHEREAASLPEQPEYVEITARPLGSSEQSVAGGPARGLEQPEYLDVPTRPPGSSEQSATVGGARGGASEQTHWTPPRSGRGR
ncbi:DUF4912 domain-containing protein [Hyalangium gracile]|uniref:DUF4912 domain-containing protein n=1 Tax=Hyalangium gracile TaxID=394092 RepID=UPI001CCDDE3E|nr:DUF4912 domain-containing protein [Hyalangium gracile]